MRAFTCWLLAVTLVSTASCGFTLRTETVADQLGSLHVDGGVPRDVRIAIERQARRLNVSLSDAFESAGGSIKHLHETQDLRSTRTDPLGRTVEYWVSIRWDVTTHAKSSSSLVLHASESVGLDEHSLIGFEKERTRMLSVLREELAVELILHLGSLAAMTQ